MVPPSDMLGVELKDLVPISDFVERGLWPRSLTQLYDGVHRDVVPVVKVGNRLYSHPSWILARAAEVVGGPKAPPNRAPSRKRAIENAERELEAAGL